MGEVRFVISGVIYGKGGPDYLRNTYAKPWLRPEIAEGSGGGEG